VIEQRNKLVAYPKQQ